MAVALKEPNVCSWRDLRPPSVREQTVILVTCLRDTDWRISQPWLGQEQLVPEAHERKVMALSSIGQSDKPVDRARLDIREVARAGKIYSLAVDRFPGMPLFLGHPPFQVLTYRST